MIGIIVTGHGHFASGMTSAIKLIAGIPEKYMSVDYLQEDTTDDYEIHLKETIKALENCKDILIFTDIVGATPYKLALQMKDKYVDTHHIEVLSGTNLGMLVQVNMARGYVSDLYDLAQLSVEEGKKQVLAYEDEDKSINEEEDV